LFIRYKLIENGEAENGKVKKKDIRIPDMGEGRFHVQADVRTTERGAALPKKIKGEKNERL
jgi:hypothetical protein